MRSNDLARLKAEINPIDVFVSVLPSMPTPRRSKNWVSGGLCPFHDDHRTGNFHVNLDTGAFKCFSCGAKGGDVIAFVQAREGLSFPEAIERLMEVYV